MKLRCNIKHLAGKFSLRWRLVILVAGEMVVSMLLAVGLTQLLNCILPDGTTVPLALELLFFSLLVGILVTVFMAKLFFDPIKELRKAMERVAEGDFSAHLETNSSSREIREVFDGFNMMTKELRATEVLQTDFVSNVSHEFKTPINAIEGYTTLLQNTEHADAAENEYIEKILFNTHRLSNLVSNILLLSKIENQSICTNRTRFRLDEQIRQALLALESAWEPKAIEFDVMLDSVEYTGNESLMHHVWSNLIGNAVKFSPHGGIIRLTLRENDHSILFCVEDCGSGLSEEAQKHLFDKFYQADTSHKEEGNGLGLALVKRILAAAGGSIDAENIPAGGCRFRVILPK